MTDRAGGRPVDVKICGLTRIEDAEVAAASGAVYGGAILSPGFARSVDPARARALRLDGGVRLVGVVVDETPAEAARLGREAGADVLQLHGDEPPAALRSLRDAGPWRLWKAVRPRHAADILSAAERYGELADALLVDGWHPGRGGGVGVRFPWALLEEVRRSLPPGLEVVAAGGLTPYNVEVAVARLRPDVVDVSSGVETRPGEKDPELVEAFVAAVRRAAAGATMDPDRGGEGS